MENCITFPGSMPGAAASVDAVRISQEIAYIIGVDPRPYHADQVDWYLRNGIEVGLLYEAAESTTLAPCPSWAYFKAIVRNCSQDGVRTQADYQKRLETWRNLGSFEFRSRLAHPEEKARIVL